MGTGAWVWRRYWGGGDAKTTFCTVSAGIPPFAFGPCLLNLAEANLLH